MIEELAEILGVIRVSAGWRSKQSQAVKICPVARLASARGTAGTMHQQILCH